MLSVRRIVIGLALMLIAPGAGLLAQGPGDGQGPGGGRILGAGGGVNYMMVLMAPAVQTELKLSDDQKTKLFDLTREAQQKGRAMMLSAYQSGNPQMLMQIGGRLRQENEASTAKILKPEQKQRLDEIMLQIEGPLAVAREGVAGKLNMTAKQNQQVQATMLQMMVTVRQIVVSNGGFNGLGPAGIPRETILQLRAAATRQLSRILDAKQKFNFNKMLGESFDLAKIDPDLASPAVATTAADAESGKTPTTKAERARLKRKNAAAAKTAEAEAKPDDEAKDKPQD